MELFTSNTPAGANHICQRMPKDEDTVGLAVHRAKRGQNSLAITLGVRTQIFIFVVHPPHGIPTHVASILANGQIRKLCANAVPATQLLQAYDRSVQLSGIEDLQELWNSRYPFYPRTPLATMFLIAVMHETESYYTCSESKDEYEAHCRNLDLVTWPLTSSTSGFLQSQVMLTCTVWYHVAHRWAKSGIPVVLRFSMPKQAKLPQPSTYYVPPVPKTRRVMQIPSGYNGIESLNLSLLGMSLPSKRAKRDVTGTPQKNTPLPQSHLHPHPHVSSGLPTDNTVLATTNTSATIDKNTPTKLEPMLEQPEHLSLENTHAQSKRYVALFAAKKHAGGRKPWEMNKARLGIRLPPVAEEEKEPYCQKQPD